MTPIEMLLRRRSCPRLGDPGPTRTQIELIVRAALRAADHGRLRPSRFVALQAEGRDRLADAYEAVAMNDLAPDEEQAGEIAKKARMKAFRAPVVLVAICEVKEHPKVPAEEQRQSTAAACQNILNASFALGYGAYWRTGAVVRSEAIRHRLQLKPSEEVIGLIFLGTAEMPLKPLEVSDWHDKLLLIDDGRDDLEGRG